MMNRREFIKTSIGAAVGVFAVGAGGASTAVSGNLEWASGVGGKVKFLRNRKGRILVMSTAESMLEYSNTLEYSKKGYEAYTGLPLPRPPFFIGAADHTIDEYGLVK